MELYNLKPSSGSVKKRKRVGRGRGSGFGKTCGRGHKGLGARSSGNVRRGFEGGQMPLQRRVPKRGFTNIFSKSYAILNVERLNIFDADSVVEPNMLLEQRVIRKLHDGLKLLGDGEIKVPLTVRAHKVSKTAREKIEAAGGKIELL